MSLSPPPREGKGNWMELADYIVPPTVVIYLIALPLTALMWYQRGLEAAAVFIGVITAVLFIGTPAAFIAAAIIWYAGLWISGKILGW